MPILSRPLPNVLPIKNDIVVLSLVVPAVFPTLILRYKPRFSYILRCVSNKAYREHSMIVGFKSWPFLAKFLSTNTSLLKGNNEALLQISNSKLYRRWEKSGLKQSKFSKINRLKYWPFRTGWKKRKLLQNISSVLSRAFSFVDMIAEESLPPHSPKNRWILTQE